MLEGKIALVTGASRGIGKGIALDLAKQGAMVVGTATSQKGADAISSYLESEGLQGMGMVLDIASPKSVEEIIKKINADLGAPTILVNNAGITRDNLMLRMKEDEWQDIIDTNLTGVFHMTKACLKGMMKAKEGRIVHISSVVGATGNPGQANYAAAKAGLFGFSKSLAAEVATRNITSNVVAPGFIDTDMTKVLPEVQREALLKSIPMARLGSAADIAAGVRFFVSPGAEYVTGQVLHINGGMF